MELGAEATPEAGVEVALIDRRAAVDPPARSAPRNQKTRMKNQTLTLTTIMEAEALIAGLVVHARDDPLLPPRLATPKGRTLGGHVCILQVHHHLADIAVVAAPPLPAGLKRLQTNASRHQDD